MGGQKNKQLDVLSVGDVVTDAFIKLLDENAEVEDTQDGPVLKMPFATKTPFDHSKVLHAVGNSPNASVNFAKLGLSSALVSNVGSDAAGREIISTLQKAGVDTHYVHINKGKVSNYHYVLWYKEERTILVKHEDYEYDWPHIKKTDIPRWVYLSSIGAGTDEYHEELVQWLDKHPKVKLAFQPGTFQMQAGTQKLSKIYERSEILAVNREEAALISGADVTDINKLFDELHKLGPKIVVISDGPAGSYGSDGENRYMMPVYPDPKPPLERTGAGDAFTSTFVASIMQGNTVEGALQWAPIQSMNVVQHVGAQAGLLTERELADLLQQAPANYRPERI